VADMHQEFLNGMMDLSRRVVDMEDRVLSRDGDASSTYVGLTHANVLVVDDDSSLSAALLRALPPDRGWRFDAVSSGGEALDAATQKPPQVAIVKETLPDLPSSMVVKTIKSSSPDAVVLLFTPPSRERVGEVKMVEGSRLITLVPSFTDPAQLVASLEDVRDGIREKAKERRYLKVFRRDHMEFLKRYNNLRQDLLAATGKKNQE
jgi:DNA-binding response OmpR family regulator